jgi:hypothetical protein
LSFIVAHHVVQNCKYTASGNGARLSAVVLSEYLAVSAVRYGAGP